MKDRFDRDVRVRVFSMAIATASVCILTASMWAAPGETGGAGTTAHFGMTHQPLGQAEFLVNPDGSLSIDNIGSSGQDGVSIDLGHAEGWSTTLVLGAAAGGAVQAEKITCKMGRVELALKGPGIVQEFGIELTDNAGMFEVGVHALNLQPLGGDILIHAGDQLVDHSSFGPLLPPVLVSADLEATGGDGVEIQAEAIRNFTCEFVNGRYVLRAGVPIQIQIPGHGPVMGDRITIECNIDHGNNENWLFGSATILASAPNDGSGLTARVGELESMLKALGLLVRSTGNVVIVGDADGDLSISNIGSSGQDGVSIDLTNHPNSGLGVPNSIGINEPIPDVKLHIAQAIDMGMAGRAIEIIGTGTESAGGTVVDACHLHLQGLGQFIMGSADFSDLGGTMVRVEVYEAGVLTGSAVMPDGGSIGQIFPGSAGLPQISDFGISRVRGSMTNHAFITVYLDRIGSYRPPVPPGLPIPGDEIRVMAHDPVVDVESISSLDVNLANSGDVVIDDSQWWTHTQVKHKGMPHVAVASELSQGAAGELVVNPSPGTPPNGEYGVAIPLGAAEGVLLELDLSTAPLVSIESRVILKTYFETGDIPTADQFSNLLDSYVHQHDDGVTTFGAAPSGFTATQMRVEARLDGDIVDSVVLSPPFPEYVASSNDMTFTGHVTVGCRVRDEESSINGGDGEDRIEYNINAPAAFTTTLIGSATGAVQANSIVIVLDAPAMGQLRNIAPIVRVAGMPSFSILDEAMIKSGHAHRAIGSVAMEGHTCEDQQAAIISNIGSSGQDGVSISARHVSFIIGDEPPAGFTLDGSRSIDDGVIQNFIWTQVSGPSVFNTQLGEVAMPMNSFGGRNVMVAPMTWMSPESIRVRRYHSGVLTGEVEGLTTSGPVAISVVPTLPGTYVFELIVTDAVNLAGGSGGAVSPSGVQHAFVWNSPIDIGMTGIPPGPADTLQILIRPQAGGTAGPVDFGGVELRAACSEPLAIGLLEESAIPLDLCPADVAPAETGGNDVVDIDDLVKVITSWGACKQPCTPDIPSTCHADTNRNCVVDIDDLVKVITSWGGCR